MRREGGIFYTLLLIYTAMVSWYFNKSLLWLLIHVIIGPLYLVYKLLIGDLSNGLWRSIPMSYFN